MVTKYSDKKTDEDDNVLTYFKIKIGINPRL